MTRTYIEQQTTTVTGSASGKKSSPKVATPVTLVTSTQSSVTSAVFPPSPDDKQSLKHKISPSTATEKLSPTKRKLDFSTAAAAGSKCDDSSAGGVEMPGVSGEEAPAPKRRRLWDSFVGFFAGGGK